MNLNNIFYLLQYIKNITLETYNQYKIISNRDLPGGPVARSLPCNTGDRGSILVQEDPKCHVVAGCPEHNYWAHSLEPALCNKRNQSSEKPAHHN